MAKTLTVAEVIEALQKLPQDAPVYFEGSEWVQDVTSVSGGYTYVNRDGYHQSGDGAVLLLSEN